MAVWYVDSGPEQDVIVSSRVRLARNFKNFPFPGMMNNEQANEIINICNSSVPNNNGASASDFLFIKVDDLNVVDRQSMVEKHLISPEMLKNTYSKALLISNDEKISIMINEEDHLRMQCLFSGMQLDEAWDIINKVDDMIENKVEYAYDENYGYLTCCPTNVGTGMRASVMAHLPSLVMSGHINSLLNAVGKVGLMVRGLYGEGTQAMGNIFQISNQVTLGISEEETIENLKSVVRQIIQQERTERKKLIEPIRLKLEDRIHRAYGILSNARIISSDEAMKLLSDIRLGVNAGILRNVKLEVINELMILTQPANIMKTFGSNINAEERDLKRAELARQKLK